MTKMRSKKSWSNPKILKEFCSYQLQNGGLALVLGAGISTEFGLPDWETLVKRMFSLKNKRKPKGMSKEAACDHLKTVVCKNNNKTFSNLVRDALYMKGKFSIQDLQKKDLLAALASTIMSSNRGSVTRIITFNYDDLLEKYLRCFGFVVDSVHSLPTWNKRRFDAVVYHPHGLLPSDYSSTTEIVITRHDYARIINDELWKGLLLDAFRCNTCLFLGLSGEDINLLSMLYQTPAKHASNSQKVPYWGVRFGTNKNESKVWEQYGIYQQTLGNYTQLPAWLFDVCQIASKNVLAMP